MEKSSLINCNMWSDILRHHCLLLGLQDTMNSFWEPNGETSSIWPQQAYLCLECKKKIIMAAFSILLIMIYSKCYYITKIWTFSQLQHKMSPMEILEVMCWVIKTDIFFWPGIHIWHAHHQECTSAYSSDADKRCLITSKVGFMMGVSTSAQTSTILVPWTLEACTVTL